ncbi:hypothetical protein C9422_15685 [Pseudomonas sp. B1(2018)]|nr:hypothetical protein C9422_15685 [Pseudomonas sp. B1(2018)]
MLAMEVNDDAGSLAPRGALRFFASKLAPTEPAAIGHPWPGAANPASMPGCPLRRTCARPHEGAYTATASEAAYRPTCLRGAFVCDVPGRLTGRYREQARSHRYSVHQQDFGQLAGRLREQARSHS